MAPEPRILRLAQGRSPDASAAFLPDRALDGVDLVDRRGGVVAGVLVDVDAAAPSTLDRHLLDTRALRLDGSDVAVRCYLPPVAPADTHRCWSLISSVFVYGTLLRGDVRHAAVSRHAPESVLPATCPGRLVDLGEYPGMLLAAPDAPSTVHGELVHFPDTALAAAVTRLDAIEDFRGFGVAGSLYVRRLVRVTVGTGAALAWTYIYSGDLRAARPIPSGDWRNRSVPP